MSVNGMTLPNTTPANSHQTLAPLSHAATDDGRPRAAQVACINSGSTITRCKLGGGYFHSALHPRRVLDESDVDRRSGEEGARED
jgi:hypothetical protein